MFFCFEKFSSGSCQMTSKLSLLSPQEPAWVRPSCKHWLWRPINIFRQLVQESLQSWGWPNLPMTSTSTRYPTASFVTTSQSSETRPQNAILRVSSYQQQEMELKRFFLSYQKCLPFEMAKILRSADGKNFCHFKVKSVIQFAIWVANWAYNGLFRFELVENIAWKRNY